MIAPLNFYCFADVYATNSITCYIYSKALTEESVRAYRAIPITNGTAFNLPAKWQAFILSVFFLQYFSFFTQPHIKEHQAHYYVYHHKDGGVGIIEEFAEINFITVF